MEDFDKLQEIIAEELNVDMDEVTEEKSLIDDFGADSIDLFQILMAIETEFDIEVDNEEAEHIRTVGDVVQLIQECR